MAQLDQLIQALFEHSGECLVLRRGERPSMRIGTAVRPVVKNAITADHVRKLVVEIAPTDLRPTIEAGQSTQFIYEVSGNRVDVSVAATGETDIVPLPDLQLEDSVRPVVTPPPAVLTMDWLFHQMIDRGSSDLHLSSGCPPILRIDGDLVTLTELGSLDPGTTEQLLFEIAPQRNREQYHETGDTDFAYEIAGLSRFRCNLFRDRTGIGGVFRAIPSKILTADDLGLSDSIRNLCFLTKGLVVVTGPTGSGKSTTLAAMVDVINDKRSDHIITIEDPIEFVHRNKRCLVNQREVHVHTAGFKTALRAALREDPDVVLVGEMRDLETVAIALETAETGHLVFGTLHTTSAVSTVDRIIDQFPADQQEQIRIMLSESLKAVIAQTLCKKIGGGRRAAMEILMINAAVSNLIREGKTFQIPSIMQTGKAQGNVLLNDALVELVLKKQVEPQEAYMKAIDKTYLLSAFKAKNISCRFLAGEND